MARDRKCILCETVHASKQEMDEHIRSMLHHRELEKVKGRDCGHECRVCKVTVVSLTDYASHISSPSHKQNVEAAELKHSVNDLDEDYFDQALVELIEKRKEQIRKDKEAAAAKVAKEEEERKKKEEFQKRLQEAKERYRRDGAWQQPSQTINGSNHQTSWYRGNSRYNAREQGARPWHNSNQGKSATWHAQEPPNLYKWSSAELSGGSLRNQDRSGNRQCDQAALFGNQPNRLPWLSNGGSSNGIYGRNNISQYPQRGRSSLLGEPPVHLTFPSFYTQALNQNKGIIQGVQQAEGLQNGEGQTAEPDHNTNKSSKTFGSNPKLDKTCRWSPYPVSKGVESVPHKDTNPSNSLEKYPTVPKPQKQDKAPETSASNRQSRPEQKPVQSSSKQCVEEKGKHKTSPKAKPTERSSSGSRDSSCHKDERQDSTSSNPPNQKKKKPLPQKDWKTSSLLGGAQPSSKTSPSQVPAQSKSTTSKQSGVRSVAPTTIGPLKSRQERQLPEMLKKARQIVWEKRGSLDSSRNNRLEMALHIVEEQQQQKDHQQSQIGVNKENSCKQNAAKLNLPDLVRPEKPQLQSSDSSQFLQSLQVSTSTMESSEPAASTREEEEDRSKVVKEIFPVAPEEAMQAVEAGQSSESDTSRSVEAQMALDGSNTSTLSKPDLPLVLKRDLTKHISSKSKPGSHEPNLNIARRVRNVSESKRSDSEKDSGLKPTVRQLISSSGSRRNVNWDQVYQEVRKKQDKGKGMPRFGIEMVQCEQEDHSQEEEEIPVLEGIQWEALMDVSASGSSRKRSLSESSIAPTITHSMFTSQASKETPLRETFKTEQHRSSISPNAKFTQEKKDTQCQQEVEQMLGQLEAKAQKQKQPDTLTSATVKALQRSDSVLGDSSGTEQCDAQGTGKRRRATGDVPSAETSSLEHNNKRRKVKSKKERSQIDQLLAVSLREDELSRTLQTVDTSLIQARAALEAAYMEVQRLMVVKQQMTGEMSTLRNKRIELLKGMQGSCMEEAPQVKLKEEKMDSVEAEVPHMPPSTAALPSVTYTAAVPSPSPPAHPASPPSSSHPFMPIVIKEEPQSPVHVSSEPDPVDIISHCAHSTTPALPGPPPPTASPPGASETLAEPSLNFRPSPERKPKLHQTNTDHHWENFEKVALPKETQWQISGASGVLADPSLDFRPSPEENPELHQTNTDHRWENFGKVASPTHETQWELSGASETLADPSLNLQPSPERNPELHQPNTDHHWENFVEPADCKESLSALVETMEKSIHATRNSLTPDSKSSIKLLSPSRRGSEVGDVVACAATHSFEQPSVPSTLSLPPSPGELRSGKRVRKLKKRKVLKKAQSTEQFESSDTEVDGEISKPRWLRPRRRPSGSSQVSTSTQPTDDREGDIIMEGVDDASRQLCPIARVRKPSKNMAELPSLAPTELTVNLDSEESMEVTTACMESHIDAQVLASTPAQIPHISRPELQQRLACNEVSSTSDMDICRSSESDMPFPTTLPNTVKTSSDASTDHEHSHKDLPTEGVFEGHQEAVNAMQIHNGLLYTCSGDRTVKAFDLVSHKCVGVFEGHSSKVSCLFVSAAPSLQHRLYTGSSDQIIRCYNLKTRELEQQFQMPDRVLCLHSRWKVLYVGLGNGTVVTFNLKTNKQMEVFECHGPRAVSCLASSQEGARRILLVGSYDKTITVRDAKNGLLLRTLDGHTKTVLCMKVVNDLVFSGSSDQCVYAHNIHTGEVVRVYKGHSHAVTVVAVLGQVMVTACLDKLVHVYDLWSHDQMQVYGGHKDMVMCMAIHKTMIYTGCYDGSVQAVKLNLMQNYRCWWHGCPLVFGVLEHLQQHLIHDHTNVNVQTLKCRWRNCEEFFCARNSSKQGMLMHMKKHLDEEFELEP